MGLFDRFRNLQTWVRFPLALPHSLQCREIRPDGSENRGKWPQFRSSFLQTGPEKVLRSTPDASFRAFFSGGHSRSPVSTTTLGECNAITSRSLGESALDFLAP